LTFVGQWLGFEEEEEEEHKVWGAEDTEELEAARLRELQSAFGGRPRRQRKAKVSKKKHSGSSLNPPCSDEKVLTHAQCTGRGAGTGSATAGEACTGSLTTAGTGEVACIGDVSEASGGTGDATSASLLVDHPPDAHAADMASELGMKAWPQGVASKQGKASAVLQRRLARRGHSKTGRSGDALSGHASYRNPSKKQGGSSAFGGDSLWTMFSAFSTGQADLEEKTRDEDADSGDDTHNAWGDDDSEEQYLARLQAWRDSSCSSQPCTLPSSVQHMQLAREGRAHRRLQQRRLVRMESSSSEGSDARSARGARMKSTGELQKSSKARAAQRARAAHKAAFAVAAWGRAHEEMSLRSSTSSASTCSTLSSADSSRDIPEDAGPGLLWSYFAPIVEEPEEATVETQDQEQESDLEEEYNAWGDDACHEQYEARVREMRKTTASRPQAGATTWKRSAWSSSDDGTCQAGSRLAKGRLQLRKQKRAAARSEGESSEGRVEGVGFLGAAGAAVLATITRNWWSPQESEESCEGEYYNIWGSEADAVQERLQLLEQVLKTESGCASVLPLMRGGTQWQARQRRLAGRSRRGKGASKPVGTGELGACQDSSVALVASQRAADDYEAPSTSAREAAARLSDALGGTPDNVAKTSRRPKATRKARTAYTAVLTAASLTAMCTASEEQQVEGGARRIDEVRAIEGEDALSDKPVHCASSENGSVTQA